MNVTSGSSRSSAKGSQYKRNEATIKYELSDLKNIEVGWTKLPSADKEYARLLKSWSCFKKLRAERRQFYSNGKLASVFKEDGSIVVYYPNGGVAIELLKKVNGVQLVVVYSDLVKPPSEFGKNSKATRGTVIGKLDSLGNCAMYDNRGSIVVTYDRFGGVMYDNNAARYSQWEWCNKVRGVPCPRNGSDCFLSNFIRTKQLPRRTLIQRVSQSSNTSMSVSVELLRKAILKTFDPTYHIQKRQKGQFRTYRCKISDCISLDISSRQKIQLYFATHGYKVRLEVGVDIDDSAFDNDGYVGTPPRRPNFNDPVLRNILNQATERNQT